MPTDAREAKDSYQIPFASLHTVMASSLAARLLPRISSHCSMKARYDTIRGILKVVLGSAYTLKHQQNHAECTVQCIVDQSLCL